MRPLTADLAPAAHQGLAWSAVRRHDSALCAACSASSSLLAPPGPEREAYWLCVSIAPTMILQRVHVTR